MPMIPLAALAFFGPGLPLGIAYVRRNGGSWPAALAIGATMTMAYVAAGAYIAKFAGLNLDEAGLIMLALAVLGACAAAAWGRARSETVIVGWPGLALAVGCAALARWQRPYFGFTTDLFYHLAATRSLLATGRPLVTDPMYGTATTALDPTSGVFHTWLALVAKVGGVQPESVYVGFNTVAAAFVVLALWGAVHRLVGSQLGATVAVLGFAGLSSYSDFRSVGYPNRFAAGAAMVALQFAGDVFRRPGVAGVLLTAAAAVAATTVHLGAGLFVVTGLGLFGLFVMGWSVVDRGAEQRWRPVLAMLAVGVLSLGALAPMVLGRFNTVASTPHFASSATVSLPDVAVHLAGGVYVIYPGAYVGGGPVAFIAASILAILAVVAGWRSRDREMYAVGAMAAIPLILLWSPLASIGITRSPYLYARLALMGSFLPWVAAAWGISRIRTLPRGRARAWHLGLVAALLVGHLAFMFPRALATWSTELVEPRKGDKYTVFESRNADIRGGWGRALSEVRSEVGGRYPVVAASQTTGYYLAGLVDVAIVSSLPSHSPLVLGLESGEQRERDMARLLDPTSSLQARREILDRYDARYVALSPGTGREAEALESMRAQPTLFEVVVESRRLVLLKVRE